MFACSKFRRERCLGQGSNFSRKGMSMPDEVELTADWKKQLNCTEYYSTLTVLHNFANKSASTNKNSFAFQGFCLTKQCDFVTNYNK